MWVCMGGTWGCFTRKRSPKCGILSSKLRSPVCKGRRRRRRRWGCGSVRAVSVWPAHVTCLLLRAMAVAKEQVSPRQRWLLWSRSSWRWFGLSVGVWGGVVRYVHGDHRQMRWEHCSHPCLWFPPPLTKGTDPEVCFSNMPECKSHVRASLCGRGGEERCVKKCEIY